MDFFKKIFNILSMLPIFAPLFQKAAKTGKIEAIDAISALSNISPETQKLANAGISTIKQGGSIPEAVNNAINSVEEIDVSGITGKKGQKIKTKNVISDLRNTGEPNSIEHKVGNIIANIFENLIKGKPEETVKFYDAASDLNNWSEILQNNK